MTRRQLLQTSILPLVTLSESDKNKLFRQGIEAYKTYTLEGNAHAQQCFKYIIGMDPMSSRAHALVSATYRQDNPPNGALALQTAHKAVELASPRDAPYAFEQLGWAELYVNHNHDTALSAAHNALKLLSNFFPATALMAHIWAYKGDYSKSLQLSAVARRMNPNPSFLYDFHEGHAYVVAALQCSEALQQHGYWTKAHNMLDIAFRYCPQHHPSRAYLSASLMALGHHNAATALLNFPRKESLEGTLPYADHSISRALCVLWDSIRQGMV